MSFAVWSRLDEQEGVVFSYNSNWTFGGKYEHGCQLSELLYRKTAFKLWKSACGELVFDLGTDEFRAATPRNAISNSHWSEILLTLDSEPVTSITTTLTL
jgi:hypothetical protein